MEYVEWFCKRLTDLRIEKGVSARDMSLSIGQSESYINKIENKHALPSLSVFFYICEYLDVTPRDFFDDTLSSPKAANDIEKELGKLTVSQAEHLLQVIKDITGK